MRRADVICAAVHAAIFQDAISLCRASGLSDIHSGEPARYVPGVASSWPNCWLNSVGPQLPSVKLFQYRILH
jgi:hypothetical protein